MPITCVIQEEVLDDRAYPAANNLSSANTH